MARRVFAVVFGVFGVLVGAALMTGAVWLLGEDRDDDGFYATETHTFERSSSAIVSGDFDQLTEVPSWFSDLIVDPVDVRIEAVDVGGEALFVGIAPTADVDRYLSGVAHDEVQGLDLDGRSISSVDYASREGNREATAPAGESLAPRAKVASTAPKQAKVPPTLPPQSVVLGELPVSP